jgi:hypothetical protein
MKGIAKINKTLTMLGLMLVMYSCIPLEDPIKESISLEQQYTLPQILSENSGMTEFDGLIWFINDSGNDSVLYGYDRGQNLVVRTVAVKNATNIDWEDITQNENYLFVGDFGNNAGSRTDLRLIRINKSDLLTDKDTVVQSGIIEFTFEDQTGFIYDDKQTPFDCEAFIATEDSIILFAKDWQNQQTRLYSLPVQPGNYVAKLRKQWNVGGLITAATLSDEKQELYLVGYTKELGMPFLWIYSGFNVQNLKYDEGVRTDFNFLATQTEAITTTEDGSILISSEKFSEQNPAALFIIRGSN